MPKADNDIARIGEVDVEINRRDIKNIHLSVLPPNGRVRLSVPTKTSEQAIRLAVVNKLAWIKNSKQILLGKNANLFVKWLMVNVITYGVVNTA